MKVLKHVIFVPYMALFWLVSFYTMGGWARQSAYPNADHFISRNDILWFGVYLIPVFLGAAWIASGTPHPFRRATFTVLSLVTIFVAWVLLLTIFPQIMGGTNAIFLTFPVMLLFSIEQMFRPQKPWKQPINILLFFAVLCLLFIMLIIHHDFVWGRS